MRTQPPKNLKKTKRIFTILEVVVAVAILSIAFIMALQMATGAADRTAKALRKWQRSHMLANATEYFLLAGPDDTIPQEFFPYSGFSAECAEEPPDIPEDVDPNYGAWRLAKFTVTIKDESGDIVDAVSVHKIVRNH